jgi:hypothetical protein
MLSLYMLSLTLRHVPVGVVYAIWSGVGIVLVSVVAWQLYGQKLDLPAIIGMAMIIGGVLVLNLFSALPCIKSRWAQTCCCLAQQQPLHSGQGGGQIALLHAQHAATHLIAPAMLGLIQKLSACFSRLPDHPLPWPPCRC